MEKITAYEIDGVLYTESDALKKLDNDYGDNVLTLSKILVQNVTKYGQMINAIDENIVIMSKIVKARARLQEFKKMINERD